MLVTDYNRVEKRSQVKFNLVEEFKNGTRLTDAMFHIYVVNPIYIDYLDSWEQRASKALSEECDYSFWMSLQDELFDFIYVNCCLIVSINTSFDHINPYSEFKRVIDLWRNITLDKINLDTLVSEMDSILIRSENNVKFKENVQPISGRENIQPTYTRHDIENVQPIDMQENSHPRFSLTEMLMDQTNLDPRCENNLSMLEEDLEFEIKSGWSKDAIIDKLKNFCRKHSAKGFYDPHKTFDYIASSWYDSVEEFHMETIDHPFLTLTPNYNHVTLMTLAVTDE